MIGSNVTPELTSLGLSPIALTMLRDMHTNVGGPIKADKLWYFGSDQNYTTSEVVSRFPYPGVRGIRNLTGRLTYKVGNAGQLGGLWLYDKRIVHYAGGGVTNPDPLTTTEQRSPKNMFAGNYTTVLNATNFIEAVVSHFDLKNPFGYSNDWFALTDAERKRLYPTNNLTTGVNSGPPAGASTFDSDRFAMNFALTRYQYGVLGANHQIKTGFENWYGFGGTGRDNWNGAQLQYRNDANGVPQPAQFNVYATPLRQKNSLRNFGAFFQDRITYPRVTLNLGVRWNFSDGMIREQIGGGNQWYPRVTYPAIDPGFNWNTVVPRLGVVFKLTDDGKTVAKTSFSQYAAVLYTQTFDIINPNIIRDLATYQWFGDRNNNAIIDPGEYNPNPLSVFRPASNTIDPNLKNPINTEFTVGVERELARNMGVSVLWLKRRFTNNYADVNVGIPTSAYVPRTFSDPGPDNIVNTGDDRPITLFDVAPAFVGKDAFVRQNVDGISRYESFELMLNKRMSNRWQLSGSYVWSRAYGVLMGVAGGTVDDRLVYDPTNPNLTLNTNFGRQAGIDQPHQIKLIGSYQVPGDVTIGTIYQGLSGLPRDRTFRADPPAGIDDGAGRGAGDVSRRFREPALAERGQAGPAGPQPDRAPPRAAQPGERALRRRRLRHAHPGVRVASGAGGRAGRVDVVLRPRDEHRRSPAGEGVGRVRVVELARRQLQPRAQAASRRALERDRAAVQLGEIAHDREAEARAGRRFVGPHAAAQDVIPHRRFHARAVVVHGDRRWRSRFQMRRRSRVTSPICRRCRAGCRASRRDRRFGRGRSARHRRAHRWPRPDRGGAAAASAPVLRLTRSPSSGRQAWRRTPPRAPTRGDSRPAAASGRPAGRFWRRARDVRRSRHAPLPAPGWRAASSIRARGPRPSPPPGSLRARGGRAAR